MHMPSFFLQVQFSWDCFLSTSPRTKLMSTNGKKISAHEHGEAEHHRTNGCRPATGLGHASGGGMQTMPWRMVKFEPSGNCGRRHEVTDR